VTAAKPRTNGKPGPKTPAAKAAVRRNAVKHGLTAIDPVIPEVEDWDEWWEYIEGFKASLSPEGLLEEELVQRIAALSWRLRRVTRFEVRATMRNIKDVWMDATIAANYMAEREHKDDIIDPDPEQVYDRQLDRVIPKTADLEKVMRYETHLHRQFVQVLHELEALQARRRGEQTHLARVDMSSPPRAFGAAPAPSPASLLKGLS
jgi:hypothetical protein